MVDALKRHVADECVLLAYHKQSLVVSRFISNPDATELRSLVPRLGDASVHTLELSYCLELRSPPLLLLALRSLGSLVDLRMDENDLDCPADSLAPLCKLRYLRILSWEKNRLTELPPLIGTMLSLRKLLLHSNQLMELPGSLCLLTSLETLDIHKNLIPTLPQGIGNMKALQKLDLSENKLAELPVTICELNDTLSLMVGRNPLEKPSIEQARQGIGAIRRFFGWSKKKEGDESTEDKEKATIKPEETDAKPRRRPTGRRPPRTPRARRTTTMATATVACRRFR